MDFRLLGTGPLSEPMLVYRQLEYWEQISVKFKSKYTNFQTRKLFYIFKISALECRPLCIERNVLRVSTMNRTYPDIISPIPEAPFTNMVWLKRIMDK